MKKTMKLSATDTSTSIAELIDDETVMQEVEAKREANEQSEFEISVGSWDTIYIETIGDEASASDSAPITDKFRFKTFDLSKVFVIAESSTDFFITLVW